MQPRSVKIRWRRNVRALLALFALVSGGIVAAQPTHAEEAEKVVIGLIGVYSGTLVPAESEPTKSRVIDRVSEINSRGGVLRKQLVVSWGDSYRDPKQAHASAVRLAVLERA